MMSGLPQRLNSRGATRISASLIILHSYIFPTSGKVKTLLLMIAGPGLYHYDKGKTSGGIFYGQFYPDPGLKAIHIF